MKRTTQTAAKERLAPDGYEWEDAPEEVRDSLGAGSLMPADFLPAPEDLVLKAPKRSTTIRLDADVLDWFKSMGAGYQTKINAVLRAYYAAHRGA